MWQPACYLGNRVLQNSNPISDAKAVYRLSRNVQLRFPYAAVKWQGGGWVGGGVKSGLLATLNILALAYIKKSHK